MNDASESTMRIIGIVSNGFIVHKSVRLDAELGSKEDTDLTMHMGGTNIRFGNVHLRIVRGVKSLVADIQKNECRSDTSYHKTPSTLFEKKSEGW